MKSSRQIRTANGGKPLAPMPGAWERELIEDRRGRDKAPVTSKYLKGEVSDETKLALAQDKMLGMTNDELASKYGVAQNFVDLALKDVYLHAKDGKKILKGMFLKNAIGCAAVTATKMQDLTAMQAAVASKTFAQGLIDLEKHDANMPKEIDSAQIGEVAKFLQQMGALAEEVSEEQGSILDSEV